MKENKVNAVDYVLGELDDLESARFERELDQDPALRAQVDDVELLARRLGSLSSTAWNHAVPEPMPVRRPGRWAPALRIPRPALWGALAALAAAVVTTVLVLGASKPTKQVRLTALAGAPAQARATATLSSADHAEMVVEGLHPTDRRHYYELWLMTSTKRLLPVASFRVNGRGNARMSLPLPAPADRYRYLDVSVQRVGGSGGISGISVLRGSTAGA